MPKLRLKRTEAEQIAHDLRKKLKREAKRARKRHDDDEYDYDNSPGPSSSNIDYDAVRAQVEEERFRQKMSDAFADDERLDAVEARFNDFAHVPKHWGGNGPARRYNYEDVENDEFMRLNPAQMEEEEYAEWIRAGMYR
jgi:hypothetical protein